MRQKFVQTCSVGEIEKIKEKNKGKGFLLLVAAEGCPSGPEMEKLMRKMTKGIPVVKAPLGKDKCDNMFKQLHLPKSCPAVVQYGPDGKEVRRLVPKKNATWGGVEKKLGKIVASMSSITVGRTARK